MSLIVNANEDMSVSVAVNANLSIIIVNPSTDLSFCASSTSRN